MAKKKCTRCNRELLTDYLRHDRNHCISCMAYGRRVDKSLDRLEWDHIRALREAVTLGHRPGANQRRTKEQRQEERKLIASKLGKDYAPRGKIRQSTINRTMDILSKQNSMQAWNYWIKIKAPDWWLDTYYMATGKPWLDHRMSDAEQYTCKYDNSAEFRVHERERVRLYKYSHPETVAGWDDTKGNKRKWNQAAIAADGTVTKAVIRRLTVEKNCAYCYALLDANNRQIDHVDPLSKGGAHSASNLVAACWSCNASKGAKKLWQWLGQLEERMCA